MSSGLSFARRAFIATAASALLAGCSFARQQNGAVPPMASSATHRDRMAPGGESGSLLYVSDQGTNEVRVYSWPALDHIGTLTGFNTPGGECVDAAGNVWIVNVNGSDLVRYAHGASHSFKKLHDPGVFPHSCSVNPKNGDVAVANEQPRGGNGSGSVSIYENAVDSRVIYKDPAFHRIAFLAYYGDGTLFLDGKNADGAFQMATFKDKKFTPLRITGAKIETPGGVFADGLELSVGDLRSPSGHAVVYQITADGTVTGSTSVNSEVCAQYFITGSGAKRRLICPNFRGPSVDVYDYPAGGTRVDHIKAGLEFPFGSAISP